MESAVRELEEKGNLAKSAARKLAFLPTETKNRALLDVAEAVMDQQKEILAANKIDYEESKASGMSEAMLDRLLLSPGRLESIAQDTRTVAALPDPVGEIFEMRSLPNGLQIGKKRVPLGVIGAVYESRPNVTIDISSLCLKSGNASILRGGREAVNSNSALARVAQEACSQAGVPQGAIQFVQSTERALVNYMLKMKGVIDLIIPRGGPGLIKLVSENASMPVISGGVGVCHTYVDKSADLNKAVAIVYNAKVQRPTVCNALDCVLVHSQIAQAYLPAVAKELAQGGVEMHCDERAIAILERSDSLKSVLVPATGEDWGKEYLSLKAAIKVVDSLDEALAPRIILRL